MSLADAVSDEYEYENETLMLRRMPLAFDSEVVDLFLTVN